MVRKILKILGGLFLLVFIVLIVLFYRFSAPKSNQQIQEDFREEGQTVFIRNKDFQGFNYRILSMQQKIDTTLPTLVFIHGSIGSALDFKKYLIDQDLNNGANLIAYDRVGYGPFQAGDVQTSIKFESALLEDLLANIDPEKTVLIGYSYGGPIALASKKDYKKLILVAPAVYSKVEPMPWALNLYKWSATRWLLPKTWQAASKEKLSHPIDLENYENDWFSTPAKIVSIHGDEDWIVPYENSLFLKENFKKEQFELVTLKNTGHGLVWSQYNVIKNQLLQQLN